MGAESAHTSQTWLVIEFKMPLSRAFDESIAALHVYGLRLHGYGFHSSEEIRGKPHRRMQKA